MPESLLSLLLVLLLTEPGGCILHFAKLSLEGVRLRDDRLPRGIPQLGGLASLLSSAVFLEGLDDLSFLVAAVLLLLSSDFDLSDVFFDLKSLSNTPGVD